MLMAIAKKWWNCFCFCLFVCFCFCLYLISFYFILFFYFFFQILCFWKKKDIQIAIAIIVIQHEKCIQMSTNKPSIGAVVSKIDPVNLRKYLEISPFVQSTKHVWLTCALLQWRSQWCRQYSAHPPYSKNKNKTKKGQKSWKRGKKSG